MKSVLFPLVAVLGFLTTGLASSQKPTTTHPTTTDLWLIGAPQQSPAPSFMDEPGPLSIVTSIEPSSGESGALQQVSLLSTFSDQNSSQQNPSPSGLLSIIVDMRVPETKRSSGANVVLPSGYAWVENDDHHEDDDHHGNDEGGDCPVVPEPSTYVAGLGLVGVLFYRYIRRRKL